MTTKIEVTLRWMNDVVEVRRIDSADKLFARFTLGTRDEDDLFVPLTESTGAPGSHTLLSRAPDGRVWLALPTGEVGPVTEQTRAAFTAGPFTVEVTAAAPEAMVPWLPSFDTLFANVATLSMSATVVAVALMVLFPTPVHAGALEPLPTSRALSTLMLLKPTPPPRVPAFEVREPTAGEPTMSREHVGGAKTPRPAVDVAGLFDHEPTTTSAVSLDAYKHALGNVRTAGGTESGIASRDLGAPGVGTEHIGGLDGDRFARDRGTLEGDTCKGCEGSLTDREDRDVNLTQDKEHVHGPIDKEIIRRVVREHMAQVRYCYEKQLQREPGLAGKISMQWMIDPSGKVMQASALENGVSKDVGNCLSDKVRTWVFPKLPPGAGTVAIRYPFVFKPS